MRRQKSFAVALITLIFMAGALAAGCRGEAAPAAVNADVNANEPANETAAGEVAKAPTELPTESSNVTITPTSAAAAAIAPPMRFGYRVVDQLPHDLRAFTQGLVYEDDIFYEGTGLRGESTLRKVDPATGEVQAGIRYPDQYFAEGITVLGDRIFQLTWQSNTGFILDKATLELLDQFSYPTEGWGLTDDGARLIMSDGTATLIFLDPTTLAITGQVAVQDDQGPVAMLNELEYIDGQVYANIWQTEQIAIIDPATGHVMAYIDLAGLPDEDARAELMTAYGLADEQALAAFLRSRGTLNGIAYDAEEERLFVTGKLWPEIYEIELEAR